MTTALDTTDVLATLRRQARERARIVSRLAELDGQRDRWVCALFDNGIGATTIARAVGLTTAGVYKIRNRQVSAEGDIPATVSPGE